jgi:aminopeptidase
MDKNLLKKYADVVIKKGVSIYKGQALNITCGIADYDFALILSESAYQAGARFVEITISSNELMRNRIIHSDGVNLSFVPEYRTGQYNEFIADDWAFIRIDNTAEFDILTGVDPDSLEKIFKGERASRKRFLEFCSKHRLSWCVIASPNAKWAKNVFKSDAEDRAAKKLDEALIKILRLDADDPVKAWEKHSEKLIERSRVLSELSLDKLVIKSAKYKTDLEVGLNPTSRWIGGPKKTPDGRSFIPNIPTEEVFTTPDFNRTNGMVHTTRPVVIMENVLNGVWFEFKNGRVSDFGADNGKDILKKFLETDDGSNALGEVALVDMTSLIYESGLIFNTILYDENASCHIALGNGYPSCLTNGQSLKNKDELRNAGCNTSLVHTDFMIGAEDTEVTGVSKDGKPHKIMENGIFII